MTVMSWVMVGGLVAALLLTAVGALAFWPEWPPIEPGVHRARGNPAHPANPAPALEPAPVPAPAPRVAYLNPRGEDEWTWTLEEAKRARPRHRYEDVGQETTRLPWHEVPQTGEQPLYPPQ